MRLRPGEAVLLAWCAAVLVAAGVSGRWDGLSIDGGRAAYNAMTLLLQSVLVGYGLRWLLLAIRGVLAIAQARPDDLERLDPGFLKERELLAQAGSFLRDIAPPCAALAAYDTTGFLIDVLHGDRVRDSWLIAWDLRLFGRHVAPAFEAWNQPLATELISLGYFSHLLAPAGVLLFLFLRARRTHFVEASQGFMLVMVLGYLGYVLVPAVGPAVAQADLFTRPIEGGAIERLNALLIQSARQPRDVFPSLHVALSALMLAHAFRASLAFGLLLFPFTLGNWIGTLYLRYHYGVDVLAGFALALCVYVGTRRWAQRRLEPDGPARPRPPSGR